MPRKKSEDFYRLHGFTPNFERGKYTATCHYCDKVLQNSALTRLSLHRQTCNKRMSKGPVALHTSFVQNDPDDQHRIQIQTFSGEDADVLGSEGQEIIVKINEILNTPDYEMTDHTRIPILVKSETRRSDNPDQEPEQHMEFEICTTELADDSKEQSLEDSAHRSHSFDEAKPKHNLAALRAEKTRAEIRQYQSKTKFIRTETENLKVERTLALLKIQKLRLEIDALRA